MAAQGNVNGKFRRWWWSGCEYVESTAVLTLGTVAAEIVEAEINFLNYFIGAFAAIFPVVNPFSTMPLLLSLTAGMSERARRRQAIKAAVLSGVLMLIVLFAGAAILHFFAISLGALRVAGGMIVAYIGFRMLFPAAASAPPGTAGQVKEGEEPDFSFMPLAFPSLVGAGAMAVVMGMATHVGDIDVARHRAYAHLVVGTAIIAVAMITWVVLRASTRLVHVLGDRGLDAMTRMMGLLLVCIGVQFVATGINNFIQEAAAL
jgi:multiple antibiotic resistance protein